MSKGQTSSSITAETKSISISTEREGLSRQHVARTSNMLPVSRKHVSLCIQQQTGNKLATILLMATSNMLPGNMLPWCKRGFRNFKTGTPIEHALSTATASYKGLWSWILARGRRNTVSAAPGVHAACLSCLYWHDIITVPHRTSQSLLYRVKYEHFDDFTVFRKNTHLCFDYNTGNSWSILILFVPLETGINTQQFTYFIPSCKW